METSSPERHARARRIERQRVRLAMLERMFGAPRAPVRIGRFEVRRKLGEGASSIVYAAFDPTLEREVALKCLLVDDAEGSAAIAEARAMAQLRHPNLLTIFEAGMQDGMPYLVMELIEGGTLREHLSSPRSPEESLALVVAIGRGLAEAHRRGLVHRDLKPENILVDGGRPRVADFGLVRGFGAVAGLSPGRSSPLPGTPGYMAPEQRAGQRCDPASDQYAYALVAFELCFGGRPDAEGLARAAPHPLAFAAPILARAAATSPSERWPSVDALVDALTRGGARPRRRWAVAVSLVVAALFAAAGIVALVRSRADVVAGSRSDRAAAIYADVAPFLANGRYAECADRLAERADSTEIALLWVECADRSDDAARLGRACAFFDERPLSERPDGCDPVRLAARRAQLGGDLRGCVERILAAPPTLARGIVLARCGGPLRDPAIYQRECVYRLRLEGHPSPERGCGQMQMIDATPDGGW